MSEELQKCYVLAQDEDPLKKHMRDLNMAMNSNKYIYKGESKNGII